MVSIRSRTGCLTAAFIFHTLVHDIAPEEVRQAGNGPVSKKSKRPENPIVFDYNISKIVNKPFKYRRIMVLFQRSFCLPAALGESVLMDDFLLFLDYFGVVVFAITGCLVAARRGVDIVGFALLGTVTGIGGGTIRDLVLGRPVFWVDSPFYLVLCTLTALLMFFGARWMVGWRVRALLWADAVGLGVFTIIGTQIGLMHGASFPVCILTGIMTATFGGMIRDVLSGEPTLVLRREIYVTACFCGAIVFWLLARAGTPEALSMPASFAATFGIRALGLWKGLTLPGYGQNPQI